MIDWAARRAKEDKVSKVLDGLDEFEKWTALYALFNEGKRVMDAPRMIEKLAPRVAPMQGALLAAKGTRP